MHFKQDIALKILCKTKKNVFLALLKTFKENNTKSLKYIDQKIYTTIGV